MFDELSSRFEDAVKGLRGEAKISENNINDAFHTVDARSTGGVNKKTCTDYETKSQSGNLHRDFHGFTYR